MTRRSFFTAIFGALALPIFKQHAHRVAVPAPVARKRAHQFPTLVIVDRKIGLDCLTITLFYDHADDSLPAPLVMNVERYMNAWKAVAWAEARETPVVVDRELAHALAGRVTVGEYLPRELYQPVAEIVARLERTWATRMDSVIFDWTHIQRCV